MDHEKSITAKLTDALSKAAGSVKSAASSLVDKASNAAQHAMEVNAEKLSRIPPAKTDPAQVAATTNEQVTTEVSDAVAMPMPLFPVAPTRKKKQAPNNAATKTANKATKKAAVTKTKKTAKKSSVRASKTVRRKSRK